MLKSTYTAPPPLPPGWTEHEAPSGHSYYYNSATKQSTYKRPTSQPVAPQLAPDPAYTVPVYAPGNLPPFSSAPYGSVGPNTAGALPGSGNQGRGGFRGNRDNQDRRYRQPEDRPKSKHAIPSCDPWVLVKTKLGRRFVHNLETKESLWKYPENVLKGVVELDRLERAKKEKKEHGKVEEQEQGPSKPGAETCLPVSAKTHVEGAEAGTAGPDENESDEYEEIEVTDSEAGDGQSGKRRRTGSQEAGEDQPVEFKEEDIEHQLAAMGEEYGLDPGEYGEPGDEEWEAGAEGLQLTDADATALFRGLLDDYQINPYTTWEKIIEEGRIIDDSRYTVLPNMKLRREVWSAWSRDHIQELKERKEKEEKQDPRIKYLAFLQDYATPKLYWPEFKRKYRKEPEMKHTQMSDKDREKYYRDHISRLKLPETTRKLDLSTLLKTVPVQLLNRSSNIATLPPVILTDIRYISLPSNVRDPLIEIYISTLSPVPEEQAGDLSVEEQEERERMRLEREKRGKAFTERERRVQEEKRRQRGNLMRGRNLLQQEEAEVEQAMRISGKGLKSYLQSIDGDESKDEEPSK